MEQVLDNFRILSLVLCEVCAEALSWWRGLLIHQCWVASAQNVMSTTAVEYRGHRLHLEPTQNFTHTTLSTA